MKTYNIPVFVPHRGCPFDCVFCNQKRITGTACKVTPDDVRETIEKYLRTLPNDGCVIETAFFGGSFTGIPLYEQSALLNAAKPFKDSGKISGIRLSTRPDYINKEILDNLLKYGVTTIELGVQSMSDDVLKASNRGHNADTVREAVRLIREYPFKLGLQMMTGLPSDTPEKSIYTANELIRLKPDFVRIYPTLVIRDTYLEEMYKKGEYKPQTVDGAAELCKTLLLMFENAGITVIRIGLQPTDEICENGSVVAGPVHSAFGEVTESKIYLDLIRKQLKSGDRAKVFVNPSEISKAVGNKRSNVLILKKENIEIKVIGDEKLRKREVRCVCC